MAIKLGAEQETQLAEVRRLRLEGIKAAKDLRDADAEAPYWQAFRLHEHVLGAEDPRIAESLDQIIFFCGIHNRRAEAEPLIERSLALLRQKPRPGHRGILRTLDGLAERCRERGDYSGAEHYHKQVLAACGELLGLDHPRVAATLERCAALLREMGRESEAETFARRARAIRQVRYNGEGEPG